MAILEHIRNSTPYRLNAIDGQKGPLSNGGSDMARISLYSIPTDNPLYFKVFVYKL